MSFNLRVVTKQEEDYIKDNLVYDPETGCLWWSVREMGRQFDKPVGNLDKDGYLFLSVTKLHNLWQPKVHRVAWFLYYGAWPESQIDHINGLKNDNRISNLRQATNAENGGNKPKQKLYNNQPCSSQYKGVSWNKASCNWEVSIKVTNKKIHLGRYDNEEEAALAYNKAALELFGEYEKINDVTP